jgi:hypothetical protein
MLLPSLLPGLAVSCCCPDACTCCPNMAGSTTAAPRGVLAQLTGLLIWPTLSSFVLLLPPQHTCLLAWQSAQPTTSCSIHVSTAEKACASCATALSALLPGE